jgi:hypothetical protein
MVPPHLANPNDTCSYRTRFFPPEVHRAPPLVSAATHIQQPVNRLLPTIRPPWRTPEFCKISQIMVTWGIGPSFVPEGLDGLKLGRLARWVESKKDPHRAGEDKRQCHRIPRH